MSETDQSHQSREPGKGRPETAGARPVGQEAEVTPRPTIGVGELMVVIAYVAVVLAVARWNIGLGITTAALSCMTLVWWLRMIAERKAEGRPTSLRDRAVLLLIATCGVLLLSGFTVIAYFVVSLATARLVLTMRETLGGGLTAVIWGLVVVVFVASGIRAGRRSNSGVDPDPDADRRTGSR